MNCSVCGVCLILFAPLQLNLPLVNFIVFSQYNCVRYMKLKPDSLVMLCNSISIFPSLLPYGNDEFARE